MKTTLRLSVLGAAVLAILAGCATPGFLDLRAPPAIAAGSADAGAQKATVCIACHGPTGVSPVPNFPNLAGQKFDYLYWRLVELQHRNDSNSPMTPLLAPLADADLRDLAAYFSAQAAVPASGNANANAFADGARLYREGDAARGIVPCQGCHGVNGDGQVGSDQARYRTYPSLRGQHPLYVTQRLRDLRDGKDPLSSNNRIMHGVAQDLDDQSIQQIADWLQTTAP